MLVCSWEKKDRSVEIEVQVLKWNSYSLAKRDFVLKFSDRRRNHNISHVLDCYTLVGYFSLNCEEKNVTTIQTNRRVFLLLSSSFSSVFYFVYNGSEFIPRHHLFYNYCITVYLNPNQWHSSIRLGLKKKD